MSAATDFQKPTSAIKSLTEIAYQETTIRLKKLEPIGFNASMMKRQHTRGRKRE